ncbi:MAG: hypothetical protein H6584_06675 [Flavobacteriales bacterium]|nr:hypothetical protein [Flavobacteriales bacterium]
MKKILEAELMSLAHQILRLKNKSDIQTALMASKKLTEKLSILAFLEEHTLAIKPTLSTFEAQQVVLDIFDNETHPESTEVQEEEEKKTVEPIAPAVEKPKKVEPIPVQHVDTSISIPEEVFIPKAKIVEEPVIEKEEEEIIEDQPIESTISLDFDLPSLGELKPKKQKTKSKKSSLDSFLEELEPTPTFVKADTLKEETETQPDNSSISFEKPVVKEEKKISINDRLKKSVTIGLNDKIAFVKHLFDGSNADFVRVISQVNTLDNFEEAKDFIELLVKPDYNNWEGKEEIEERFMHAVENKFS